MGSCQPAPLHTPEVWGQRILCWGRVAETGLRSVGCPAAPRSPPPGSQTLVPPSNDNQTRLSEEKLSQLRTTVQKQGRGTSGTARYRWRKKLRANIIGKQRAGNKSEPQTGREGKRADLCKQTALPPALLLSGRPQEAAVASERPVRSIELPTWNSRFSINKLTVRRALRKRYCFR